MKMNLAAALIAAFALLASGPADAAEKKPAPPGKKPAPTKKPDPKRKPAPKPQLSIGELAAKEAKRADKNGDGKISGTEISDLRGLFAKNPKSWLYIYDDNGDRQLSDSEVGAIKLPPSAPPKPPGQKPPPKPPGKKPTAPKKPTPQKK